MTESTNEGVYYTIERSRADYFGYHSYRFVSLYNGARGAWGDSYKGAIKDGEAHTAIIKELAHPIDATKGEQNHD